MDFDQTNVSSEAGSPFFLFPGSPSSVLHEPLDTDLFPYFPLQDSQITQLLDFQAVDDLELVTSVDLLDFNDLSSSSTSPTEEYSILSLDEISSTSDVSRQSSGCVTSVSERDQSVTSRLKSMLISRQKQQQHEQGTSQNSVISLHNYTSKSSEKNKESRSEVRVVSTVDSRSSSSTLRFPPCCVCGGTASGLHYGVNSCEPCKGFFTRYLRKREEYKCAKNDNCQITNRLRGNCSACRLKKCLALGMSRKNSRLGRYSLARRMETIMQVNKLEGKTEERQNGGRATNVTYNTAQYSDKTAAVPNSMTQLPEQSNYVNGFSEELVTRLVEHMEMIRPYGDDLVDSEKIHKKLDAHYEAYVMKRQLFGNMTTIPKDEYYTLRKEFGIEIDRRLMYLKDSAQDVLDVISRYCNFARQIPNFSSLSNKDQSNLLKASRYDFFMVLLHEGYHHDQQVFLAHNGVAFHREEVADKFFSRRLVQHVCDTYRRLQVLRLSRQERALLIAVALVFTDRCGLEQPGLVDRIQLDLAQLLRCQLEHTCSSGPAAVRRFSRIIDCLTAMRDSSELYLREYSQLCSDERVIQDVPEMKEMLFDDI